MEAIGFEAVAAAATVATVAASAAAAAVISRKRKRDWDRRRQAMAVEADADAETPKRHKAAVSNAPKAASANPEAEPVVDELKRKALQSKWRHKIVYTFLDDRGRELVNYSFEDVDRAARKVAAALQRDAGVRKGDRVMLCYPPGLDFALGFWGCLYAGAVGIPVYPPYPGTLAKDLPKFNRMVADSGAKVVLTNKTYHLASKMATVKGFFSGSSKATTWPENVQWISTDALADSGAAHYDDTELGLSADDVAFFQYSSGSTSEPKAVMISHGNLRAQLKTWESILPSDTLISWLPSYHDMGLVGFIITPCITGGRCVSMSPISFIKDPAMWMRTVSKYRATHVCAPNFGYALAARKTTDKEAASMDLSTLKQTICAAEPIRPESLDAFISKFEKASGFNPNTFNCGYGLAEVTLVCTGQDPLTRQLPTVLTVDKSMLETNQKVVQVSKPAKKETVMSLVGCGKAMPTFKVSIVDPNSKKLLKDMQVGEVWIQGPSVSIGYWNRPEYTKEMFGALLAGEKNSENTFLRTGDMGFLRNGELFVTGRLKDLIIIRGRNVCPQDVEATVERAHDHIRPGCCAAFSIEKNQEEALVVVAEVKNGSSQEVLKEVCGEIIKCVLSEHQLRCEAIVLLPQRAIPKTTSGKIQRSASKAKFITSTLPKAVYEYKAAAGVDQPRPTAAKPSPKQTAAQPSDESVTNVQKSPEDVKTPAEILTWLLERVALEVQTASASGESSSSESAVETPKPAEIDPSTPWAMFGLDSVAIVGLSSELGEFLGCVVPPSAFFQYDTPEKLANAPGLATGELVTEDESVNSGAAPLASSIEEIDSSCYDIANFPEVQNLFGQMKEFESAGLTVPFLETLTPEMRKKTNFNTYNYLGNARDPEVLNAARKAITEYGSTMSSSPIVGQTQVNVDLEKGLCSFFRAEASVLFVGGWVTNVTTIDALVGKGDLILCDALNHDSCVTGQRLSGATILPYPHNDTDALERMLSQLRTKYRRVLIVTEGVYGMDGDIPNIPEMVRIKKKFKSLLFIDEAHSFGTMGETGRGICEHFGVDTDEVDVRMGTMSKALGSIGGFVLGSRALVQYLKHCAGGFVFSVGLAPSAAAAALKSIELMTASPSRTERLHDNSRYFFDKCKEHNIPIGSHTFRGGPVVVVMIGSTIATAKASEYLATNGVNVKPIVYPAVEEGKCRLRFFISAVHTTKQLDHTIKLLDTYIKSSVALEQTTTKVTTVKKVKKAQEIGSGSSEATVVVTTTTTTTSTSSTNGVDPAKAAKRKAKKARQRAAKKVTNA